MITDIPTTFVQIFLEEGGMPSTLSNQCTITPVEEGGLAVTFKIISPEGVFYLKLHDGEGARGGPFLKHLLPINDIEMRRHAEKRRHFIRKMLDSVIEQRSTLVPKPCYFDLSSSPMALQKLRKKTDHVVAELRMEGAQYPTRWTGMVGTLWKELDIEHIPTLSAERKDVWNPLDYSPENVFRFTAAIGEFQTKAEKFLETTIERKVHKGKGSQVEIQHKLSSKLQHEQRSLKGYDVIAKDFFTSLEHLPSIQEPITDLQERFLASVTIPSAYTKLPFQKLLFSAERERWWDKEKRDEGKALDRLYQASLIAKEWRENPSCFLSLAQEIENFRDTYSKLEKLPQSIVPQDAHPFNFFLNNTDGNISMLDLEDLNMGARLADLANVYVFKILRGVVQGKITEDEAITYLQAAINGYNSTASTPLTQEELALMGDYTLGTFLNFLPQFGIILRLDPAELNEYNLGMSLEAFTQQLQLLQKNSQLWRKLLPLIN